MLMSTSSLPVRSHSRISQAEAAVRNRFAWGVGAMTYPKPLNPKPSLKGFDVWALGGCTGIEGVYKALGVGCRVSPMKCMFRAGRQAS